MDHANIVVQVEMMINYVVPFSHIARTDARVSLKPALISELRTAVIRLPSLV